MPGHNQECIDATQKRRDDRAAWIALWPNFCDSCDGRGGSVYSGSWDEPPEFDICEECAAKLICPRCGEVVPGEVANCDAPCPHCGRPTDDSGAPEVFDCEGVCFYYEENDPFRDEPVWGA